MVENQSSQLLVRVQVPTFSNIFSDLFKFYTVVVDRLT